MPKLNCDQISLIISKMEEAFAKEYLTKKYFGEFANPEYETIRIFTNGYCAIFAIALKEVFPEGEYYLFKTSEGGKHIVLKIDELFYDIRGVIPIASFAMGTLEKIEDIYDIPSIFPEAYLEESNPDFFKELITNLAASANNYIEERNWSLTRVIPQKQDISRK